VSESRVRENRTHGLIGAAGQRTRDRNVPKTSKPRPSVSTPDPDQQPAAYLTAQLTDTDLDLGTLRLDPPLSGSVETARVVTIPTGRDWIF
jgi:hypothetical protein